MKSFALITLGKTTHVFMDGKAIGAGIEDVKYSARANDGSLRPTLDMKIDIERFSMDSEETLADFLSRAKLLEENRK